MDMLLLAVTAVSLALAACMTLVAGKLRRDARRRSDARVAVLESLAFGDSDADEDVETGIAADIVAGAPAEELDTTPATERLTHAPIARRARVPISDSEPDETLDPSWDTALGSFTRQSTLHASDPAASMAGAVPSSIGPVPSRVSPGPSSASRVPANMSRSFDAESEMFRPAVTTSPRGRRALVLATVAVVMIGGVSAAYIVRGDIAWPNLTAAAAGNQQPPSREDVAPLELLSLRHAVASPGQFTVTGLVQNPHQGRSVAGLVAVVYLFDGQGRYLASGKMPIEYSSLRPGDEAPFVVTIPATSDEVSRYRVGFRLPDGAVVAHVDRRGQPPASTTGEAIGNEPPAGRPRRAEG